MQITFVLIRCIASNSGLQFVDFLALLASLNPFCNQVRKQFFHNFEVRSQGKFVRKLELITCVTTFLSLQCGWSFTDCFLKHRGRYYLGKKKVKANSTTPSFAIFLRLKIVSLFCDMTLDIFCTVRLLMKS